jgi:hypothetical protein
MRKLEDLRDTHNTGPPDRETAMKAICGNIFESAMKAIDR